MQARFSLVVSLAALSLTPAASAQTAPTAPRCQRHEAVVYEAGCEGPGRLVCSGGASLPAASDWCACDGRTVTAPSMSPPTGLRYRFAGPCGVTARFELTDERRADGSRTGRVVVFAQTGNSTSEAARVAGPCRDEAAGPGELARVVCGARGGRGAVLALRREGALVVAYEGARALARGDAPEGQRVTGAPARRF